MKLFRIEFYKTDTLSYQTDKFSVIVKANTSTGAFKKFDKLTNYQHVDESVTICGVSRRYCKKHYNFHPGRIVNETAVLNQVMSGFTKLFKDFEDDGSSPELPAYMGFMKAFDFPINPILNHFI